MSRRAREPDTSGFVERNGVKVYYEVFGDGSPTIMLFPPWSIVYSRVWKAQVPYLARHFRVITFDGRGNGRSDRPSDPQAYARQEFADDALAIMDATGTQRAVIVGYSMSGMDVAILAADHADRVLGVVFISAWSPFGETWPERMVSWEDKLDSTKGWAKHNRHYWLRAYDDWLRFFASKVCTEPHSTKLVEDVIEWGSETTAEVLVATYESSEPHNKLFADDASAKEQYRDIRCPMLVIVGSGDAVVSPTRGFALAEATGAELLVIEGGGHCVQGREPVAVNLALRDFVERRISSGSGRRLSSTAATETKRHPRARSRDKRALYISSPIGLGHAQRDVAIADELRRLHPELHIDWLAQHPVTTVLERRGESIHVASRFLSSESGHIQSESHEHDLHAFQAIRRMDEILINNFMVFHDIVREEPYDLWIGDEAWELDYYLHENPKEKRAPFVWMTDFVGWIPMPEGGEHERFLTRDYNEEMIEHIARYPRLRDRSVFIGNPDDIVPDSFGAELPLIRDWTASHFEFSGYVTGFDPATFADRAALRAELGYEPDETVCIVTVGGSGVGESLLRRVIDAFAPAKHLIPSLRMIVVAGPRIDPSGLPIAEGLQLRAYVPELYRHLAACDIAVVQGGLTTTMELTANRRPFLYFPLRQHFEQNFHVRHRLDRYNAGRCMDYATSTPESIAQAMKAELERRLDYKPVETHGAARAAARIAELL